MNKPVGQLGDFDRERLRAILDAAVDAILTIDARGVIVDANPATTRLVGYGREELLGANVSLLMGGRDAERHDGYIQRYLDTRQPRIIGIGREVEARHKDGHAIPVALAVSEVNHGGERLFTGILHDIREAVARRRELEARRSEMQLQVQINQVLQRSLQVDGLLRGVLEAFASAEGFGTQPRVGAFLLDRHAQVLRLNQTVGDFSEEFLEREEIVPLGHCLCGRAAVSGEVLVCSAKDPGARDPHCEPDEPHGNFIIPLRASGEVLGVIFLFTEPQPELDQRRKALFETLGVQIGGAIQRIRAEDALRRSRKDLIEMATRDPLTSALNRRAIRRRLDDELARVGRGHTPLAVVIADIDHFKGVNDAHGHLAGDEVLVEVVRRMSLAIRPYDACSRYGGEEFLILLPGAALDEGLEVAERLREAVARTPVLGDGKVIPVRISAGVAWVDPDTDPLPGADELVRAADEALYRAKRGGRDRVEAMRVADPDAPVKLIEY